MESADVAVVIPVYNRAATVLRTLDSVSAQTVMPRRVIVIDDGSTDGTSAAVAGWTAAGARGFEMSVICQRNLGAGAARNRGIADAGDCRYVVFLDSDDCWPKDFLSRAVRTLGGDGSAVAATADRLFHRQRKRRLGFHSSRQIERNAAEWFMKHNAGVASCSLFRTSVIQRLNGFRTSIPSGQDAELFLRISKEGKWLHVPGEPVRFYVGFSQLQEEEGNLSVKFADRKRRWAQIFERFIFRQDGSKLVSKAVYSRALARSWHKTACDYSAQGRHALAAACFRKAVGYKSLQLSSWWGYARLLLANARLSASSPSIRLRPERVAMNDALAA